MDKLMMLGLGGVGRSFLRQYMKTDFARPEQVICVEADHGALRTFKELGGFEHNFHEALLDQKNIYDYLDMLDCGDYLIDFANNISNLDVLQWALEHGIHYISLADVGWDDDPDECDGFRPRFLEYKRIKKSDCPYSNTSLVMFGMNPGLVSSFVKKCISEIVNHDNSEYMTRNREKLLHLLSSGEWSKLAEDIGIEAVIEVDNDNQVFDIRQEDGVIYSPWCPESYRFESLAPTEFLVGSKQLLDKFDDVYGSDSTDLYLRLKGCAFDHPVDFYSPQGMTSGLMSSHEELFTINDMLSCETHRVTTAFIYSACGQATESLSRNRYLKAPQYKLLTRDKLLSGGESVGVIIQGSNFNTRYFGNYYDSMRLKYETATVYQVSSSVLAALCYIRSHPSEGFIFPEDVDADEILDSALAFLGSYVSCECPDIRSLHGRLI